MKIKCLHDDCPGYYHVTEWEEDSQSVLFLIEQPYPPLTVIDLFEGLFQAMGGEGYKRDK